MRKYDLHIHSTYSPCSIIQPITILKRAKKAGLDGIAVTDHNTIKGSIETRKLNKDKGFEVITASEVRTDKGDILALYIQEDIKNTEIMECIDEIKAQGGIIVIAHPFRNIPWLRFNYPIKKIKNKIDAVETFNSRNILFGNKKAEKTADSLNIAKIGASDAHIPLDIGKGYTVFESDLRKAIKERATMPKGTSRYGLLSGIVSSANKRILYPLKVKKK
ncbi:PHP domain-containing protein [Candidatus Woesearchaeota archaeon]|nr:PHP domain-containing protein [Candidatus Woesearchaeota archaeon]